MKHDTGPKENAYDEHIAPLMTRIIATCQEHSIPVVAQFQLDPDEDTGEPMFCTTIITTEDAHPSIRRLAAHLVRDIERTS